MTGSIEGVGGGTAGGGVTALEDRGQKMSASGFPYATAWIHRADGMECTARSAAAHKKGYEN